MVDPDTLQGRGQSQVVRVELEPTPSYGNRLAHFLARVEDLALGRTFFLSAPWREEPFDGLVVTRRLGKTLTSYFFHELMAPRPTDFEDFVTNVK
jgi:hypothetical protein